jgi:hypothetical protein
MKLKHFLQPLDSSFSTPKAARKLLRLFALALVLGVYVGAYSYLRAALNEEISLRRSYMNEAISDAQSFLSAARRCSKASACRRFVMSRHPWATSIMCRPKSCTSPWARRAISGAFG